MTLPLLTTKLYFPLPCVNLVPRPRLVERLQAGLRGPLTLLSAPAGSGKTTLLSEWRAGPGSRSSVAWLALDEGDNDPSRFLQHLVASLDTLQPGLLQDCLSRLQSREPPSPAAILTPLVNGLDGYRHDFVLALDDYHVIEAADVHAALTFLLDHLPPKMHLILLTRADPPLPLARLRARGQLTEIRAEHLRFNLDEAAAFLNQAMGLGLTGEQVAALERRTEGWIAGLQLAALSMQGLEDPQGFVSAFTGSHHYIMDYLAEEVLGRQPEALREFLLQTSILERLSGPLCDALTGEAGGEAVLERLEHANLFLVPLDSQRRWYRYHPLFADLLRNRLRQAHPDRLAGLHLRASQWYAQNGFSDEAIQHALAAADWPRAVQLMEAACQEAYRHDQIGKILGWGRALPAGMLYTSPCLCIFYAWAVVLNGSYAEAEKALALPSDSPVEDQEAARHVAEGKGREQILRLISFARHCWEGAHTPGAGMAFNLTQCQTYTYWYLGEMKKAAEMADENLRLDTRSGTAASQALVTGLLARIQSALGNLQEAFRLNQSILDDPQTVAKPLVFGQAVVGQADLFYEWNQLAQAAELAAKGLEFCRKNRIGDLQMHFLRLTARLHQAEGNYAAARQALDEAGRVGEEYGLVQIMLDALSAARVQLALAEGDLAEAQRRLGQIKNPVGSNLHLPTLPLEAARLALAQGNKAEAASILSERYRAAERGSVLYAQIEIRLLQALAAGDEGQALAFLFEALRWAEPRGFQRVFLDQGPALMPLLQQAVLNKITPGYSARLLEAFSAEGGGVTAGKGVRGREILSKREVELLGLIAAGRSNKEIAAKLVISLGTVKRHTVNIFNKLDVKNRTEAVARARELGLL